MIMAFRLPAFLFALLSVASAFANPRHPLMPAETLPAIRAFRTQSGAIASPATDLKTPVDLYHSAVALGITKGSKSFLDTFKLGVMAGCHIAFGMYLSCTVGAACPQLAASNPGLQKMVAGAFGLPFGLMMTLVTGGELFTGNTALLTAAGAEGKVSTKDVMKNWTASYLGNLLGSLLLAYLVFKSRTLVAMPGAMNIAVSKCSVPWDVAFVRGILCNWLVCMAVYMANGCTSLTSKMTAIWFPISAFVALGLEHSVANMFLLPFAMMQGANISVLRMFSSNLIPVTLGNIIGGAICVMLPFGSTFGKWFAEKTI